MKENRTVEMYVAQAIQDALQCQSIKYRSGEYISKRYYRKIMQEIKNCNAKEVNRDVAYMQIENMIQRVIYLCTGWTRNLTAEDKWLAAKTTIELMKIFTGYTIAAE